MDNIREKLLSMIKTTPIAYLSGRIANAEECIVSHVLKSIADHLVDNGVTVLPCKLGDTAWGIRRCHLGNAVKQGEVYQMYFGEDMRLCICVKNVCRGEWGVNVFGTKEEAEEALRKMAKKE